MATLGYIAFLVGPPGLGFLGDHWGGCAPPCSSCSSSSSPPSSWLRRSTPAGVPHEPHHDFLTAR
ncbi:hypothetical protein ACFSTC_45965 [Nonomuraea ferruginea]